MVRQQSTERARGTPITAWIESIKGHLPAPLVDALGRLGLRRGILALTLAWLALLMGIDILYPIDVSGLFLSALLILMYLLPTFLAFDRRHGRRRLITLLNVTLGWTMIGWIGLLFWSLTQNHRDAAPTPAIESP